MPVDGAFWDNESEALMGILFDYFKEASEEAQRAGVDLVSEMAGVPVGVDWDFANEHAIQWAIQNSAEVSAQITATSMEAFATKFPEWAASGAPLDDLISELEPYYGKARAAAVAVTETTNAFAKGNIMGWQATGVVSDVDFMIAEDELVCPICSGTRDNGPYALDDEENIPALHPFCRCWLQPRVNMDAVATQDTTAVEEVVEEAEPVPPWVQQYPNLAGWGKNLVVKDLDNTHVQGYLRGLNELDPAVTEKLKSKGVKVYVGNRPSTSLDSMQRFREEVPRGWSSGKTMTDVPAFYSPDKKKVILGVSKDFERAFGKYEPNIARHEIGHAVDHIYRISSPAGRAEKLRAQHAIEFKKLDPYLQQDGPGGRGGISEWIAEAFAEMNGGNLNSYTGSWIKEFIRKIVK